MFNLSLWEQGYSWSVRDEWWIRVGCGCDDNLLSVVDEDGSRRGFDRSVPKESFFGVYLRRCVFLDGY